MGNIHTIGYYSAITKSKPLKHKTTQMNLKNIMLPERSQTQNKYILLYDSIYVKSMMRSNKSMVAEYGIKVVAMGEGNAWKRA